MRYARFINKAGKKTYGLLQGDKLLELTDAPYLGGVETGAVYDFDTVTFTAPSDPSVIMCAGTNYMDHIREAIEKMHIETKYLSTR